MIAHAYNFICVSVDSCPQRFDSGVDPYDKELKIYVMDGAGSTRAALITTVSSLLVVFLIH